MTTHEAKIPYDVDALGDLGKTPEEIEAHMRALLAATLYGQGKLSLSKAAKMAGLPKVRFLFKLGVPRDQPERRRDRARALVWPVRSSSQTRVR